jgi:large subunit ribosomal protein L5
MRDVYIDKVVVHMGVGESGEKLVKAENIMKTITKQTPIRSIAKMTQPAFSIRKGAPIGCKVTLRGKPARDFFATSIGIINKTVFGMDVNVVLERKGIRITRRRMEQKKLPAKQRVKKEDAIAFLKEKYQVEVR